MAGDAHLRQGSGGQAVSTIGQVPAPRGRLLTIDNRYLPPLLITSILVGANLSFGILEGWERTALSIVVAIGTEMVLGRITYGKWPHPASAYISGISAGHSHPVAVPVAVLLHELHLDPVEVRAPPEGPPHLESDELRRQRDRVARPCDGDRAEHPVGQRRGADGCHLAARRGDRVAGRSRAHLGDLRRGVPGLLIRSQRADRGAVARNGRADHRPDVSTLHLLHDHGPEDDRALEEGAVCGGRDRGVRRDADATGRGGLRTLLRALRGRIHRDGRSTSPANRDQAIGQPEADSPSSGDH